MINKAQIKMVHFLKNKIRMPDDDYRNVLMSFGVKTSTRLTFYQAKEVIQILLNIADKSGVELLNNSAIKASSNSMASVKQQRYIMGLWISVSNQDTTGQKIKALNSFLKSKFHTERLSWLPRENVEKVICTLKSMQRTKNANKNN